MEIKSSVSIEAFTSHRLGSTHPDASTKGCFGWSMSVLLVVAKVLVSEILVEFEVRFERGEVSSSEASIINANEYTISCIVLLTYDGSFKIFLLLNTFLLILVFLF